MKRCPQCGRAYDDDTLSFCLDDGAPLSAPAILEKTMAASGRPEANFPTPPLYGAGQPVAYKPGRSVGLIVAITVFVIALIVIVVAAAGMFVYYQSHKEQTQTLSYPDGTKYEGGVRDNMPAGRGVMKFPSGDVYDGEYRDGKRGGQGVYTFHDGTRYVGEFRNDNYDGHGVMTYPDGRRQDGTWADGKFVGP